MEPARVVKRLPRNLGPPPAGPAPAPPKSPVGAPPGLAGAEKQPAGAGRGSKEPAQRKGLAVGSRSFGTDSGLADSGWDTGGTGGTVDFGLNSKAVLQAMRQHKAKLAAVHSGGVASPPGLSPVQKTTKGANLADSSTRHRGLGGIVLSHNKPEEDDQMEEDEKWEGVMGQQLEAMVEELAGEDNFFFNLGDDEEDVLRPVFGQARHAFSSCGEKESTSDKDGAQTGKAKYGEPQKSLLEDAMSKVDAARDALSTVIATQEDVTLRGAAPEFVPGQPWQGQSRSCFVD